MDTPSSATPSPPLPPAPQPPPTPSDPDAPGPPEDPAVVDARIKRRLLMGAALFLALFSIYAGLLGIPWGIQVGMAGMAVFCIFKALRVKEMP